ncbi:hypothetical protein [Sandarakinorhabdus sp.]|uniref:hypothetical protein n=1 Tax=Sandarakinorhabdus sp. TaxID=1916663 RepID=UPI00286E8059|nr:hypothetical protein [Sandarakinorhabdus sp.]
MERVIVDLDRADVAEALRAQANAHGRTVAEEVAAVVQRQYAPALIDRLRAICGDSNELYLPSREVMEHEPPFLHDDFR